MQLEVGTIHEGKVTGITKFGAFVSLSDGKSGLVHISEIANTYVSDVRDHVTEGQQVKVKIIALGDDGKINMSIKKAEAPVASVRPRTYVPRTQSTQSQQNQFSQRGARYTPEPSADQSFEDKLKQFMQESDSKNSGNRLYGDKKGSSRRKK